MQPLLFLRTYRRAPTRRAKTWVGRQTPEVELGRVHKLAVELTYLLRRIGLQQMNQLQQAALLVGALHYAALERRGNGADR